MSITGHVLRLHSNKLADSLLWLNKREEWIDTSKQQERDRAKISESNTKDICLVMHLTIC